MGETYPLMPLLCCSRDWVLVDELFSPVAGTHQLHDPSDGSKRGESRRCRAVARGPEISLQRALRNVVTGRNIVEPAAINIKPWFGRGKTSRLHAIHQSYETFAVRLVWQSHADCGGD